MKNKGFWFYENWYQSIKDLAQGDERDRKDALELALALCEYGTTGKILEGLSPTVSSNFRTMKIGMDVNKARYEESVESGKKGGRPSTQRELAKKYILEGLTMKEVEEKGISVSTYKRALKDLQGSEVQNPGSKLLDQEQVQNSIEVQNGSEPLLTLEETSEVQNSFEPSRSINGFNF